MKKILITGGTGYIGSHTVVELIEKGFDVSIIDNLSNSRHEVVDSIGMITGVSPDFNQIDLCHYEDTEEFFRKNKIDAVIHFAALKAVGDSVKDPIGYYRNNLTSLLNLIDCCNKYKVDKFLFSSSCSVYSDPDVLPIAEDSPLKKAKSPYANTKKIGEEIIADVISSGKQLKAISLRYFNPVGAHESALIGEYPIGQPTNLMPVITQVAIGKRDKMFVHGTDYPTQDGSCIRDYIHVVDIARAHVSAVERMLENRMKNDYEVFNLGTGEGVSVLEIITTFEKVTGVKVNYETGPRREGDVIKVYADTSLANRSLEWKAEKNLSDMVRTAWNWEIAMAEERKKDKNE